ncbi:MarR family winged helix-turn-helix transcriptional regulator [Kribbella italica]|uniref:DNA-binding MarR family transcriptional regulator n=1 Tax=Kribbella italica TaxID=1540520 RepID=A0A7W9JGB1_9ACTN|nr:MarR family winged helix-turn-helix transcriptional regulator [Kribbella italica]MBB5840958.1 DNA-binding MarR family transcriptional regulator [Kribbella italica]
MSSVDESIRTLLLLMPRLVGRAKRMKIPDELAGMNLAPRHLSLFAYLLFDGPLGVNDLAERLEVTPATVSLMVGDLTRQGILERREHPDDRRRAIVTLADTHRAAIDNWLARSAHAWRQALEPLTDDQRRLFVQTLRTYEDAI